MAKSTISYDRHLGNLSSEPASLEQICKCRIDLGRVSSQPLHQVHDPDVTTFVEIESVLTQSWYTIIWEKGSGMDLPFHVPGHLSVGSSAIYGSVYDRIASNDSKFFRMAQGEWA